MHGLDKFKSVIKKTYCDDFGESETTTHKEDNTPGSLLLSNGPGDEGFVDSLLCLLTGLIRTTATEWVVVWQDETDDCHHDNGLGVTNESAGDKEIVIGLTT